MKGILIYFSGTGNTKYVGELICKAFQQNKCDIQMYSMEESFDVLPDTYDFLVLGFPKYYEYPPLEFIKKVKEKIPKANREIKAMMYCTQCGPTKVPAQELTNILQKKNHIVFSTGLFEMANNFFLMKVFPPTEDFEISIRNQNVKAKVEKMVHLFLRGDSHYESMGIVTDTCCNVFVRAYVKLIPGQVKKITTSDKCNHCGKCVVQCPIQNITMEKEGPRLKENCMMCMRCLNGCPVNAFKYKGETMPQYGKLKMKK
ncbi:MAG: EFR1 family ferrodoxin [Turicibacter sp.]